VGIGVPFDSKQRGLMAYLLHFAEELRSGAEYFGDIREQKVDRDQLSLAKELIKRNLRKFEPQQFKDNYEAALRELVEAKLKRVPLPREQREEPRGKVVNLMDALRQSVGETGGRKKPPVRADGTTGKARAGQSGLKLVTARSREKRRRSA
jgi:DNA end-binding protein Ku